MSIALSIGHADISLNMTLDHLTSTFSTVRLHVEQSRANNGVADSATDHDVVIHDFN